MPCAMVRRAHHDTLLDIRYPCPMRLLSLELTQFRSYESLKLDLSQGDVHMFVGENGAGKTNVLEAISILSLTRSCLNAEEADIIQWNAEFYRVRGYVRDDAQQDRSLEVVSQQAPRTQKACFLNDVRQPVEKMLGVMPTVVFLPQELHLFSGPPAQRRKFLDRLLCQVSPEYLASLSQYQKVLKQRNSLLKSIAEGASSAGDLDVWDEHLVEHGVDVALARLELIGTLQLTLPEELIALGEKWKDVEIVYDRKGSACSAEALKEEYLLQLGENRKRDCILLSTSIGPHREDWHIAVDGRPLQTFASRGQQRASLLALLLLQVSYLELRCGEKPVILLDDVFSELDQKHQSALLDSLSGYQVLITTTHIPEGCEDVRLWSVEEGNVTISTSAGCLPARSRA